MLIAIDFRVGSFNFYFMLQSKITSKNFFKLFLIIFFESSHRFEYNFNMENCEIRDLKNILMTGQNRGYVDA